MLELIMDKHSLTRTEVPTMKTYHVEKNTKWNANLDRYSWLIVEGGLVIAGRYTEKDAIADCNFLNYEN